MHKHGLSLLWRFHSQQTGVMPLSGSMMIGFTAEADDAQPIVADGREIAEAGWFSRGNLPKHSLSLSIAGEMIGRFDRGEL